MKKQGKNICYPQDTKQFCDCDDDVTEIFMDGLFKNWVNLDDGVIPECVRKYKKLKKLTLKDVGLTRIDHINELYELNYLNIESDKVSRIENLPPRLTTLDIMLTEISKIENLPSSLTTLKIHNNGIKKIENLVQLKDLTELDLHSNQITKIEGLENNTKLESLNIENNKFTRIENLSHLKNLKKLDIGDNKIRRLDGLKSILEHGKLEELNIDYNPIIEINQNRERNLEKELVKRHLYSFLVNEKTLLSELFQLKDGLFS